MKTNIKTHYEPIFKIWVSVFVDDDQERAQKRAEKILGESLSDISFEAQAKTIDYQNGQGGQRIVVWLRRPQMSLLVHELIHVLEFSFGRRRISLELGEIVAYYLEHLVNVFGPVLERKK